MKSKTLTFPAANISTNDGSKQTATIVVTDGYGEHPAYNDTTWPAGGTKDTTYYAREFIVDNATGIDLEFVILSNDSEEALYDASPSTYTGWIKLANATEYRFKRMGKISKIVVRRVGTVATTLIDLRIDLWGYYTD